MFQLARTLGASNLATRQVPGLVMSSPTVTLFGQFGGFALEAGASLATWVALDALVEGVRPFERKLRIPRRAS